MARGLDGGLAEVVVVGGLVARRQVAGEIIALLVEGAAGARTLGVPRGGAKVPFRDVQWHLIGLVCRVLDG